MGTDYGTRTDPLSRTESVKLLLAAADELHMPWPRSITLNETGGIDGSISAMRLDFDSYEHMHQWAAYFDVQPYWQRDDVTEDGRRFYNSTAFGWNGWQQVDLGASDPIASAVSP